MDFVYVRLKEMRQSLGLSQKEVCAKLGMLQPTYAKLESGTTKDMRISTLAHICKTFNVSADWLMGLGDSENGGI